ncbi:hypothetical protein E2C01_064066 [Portunus trituberculatus]|uniref:Reverse transcriptase domain-containing protein n=1 Tax=Portunus trituberculatus TaxID=210409 RepID=A0A5B7HJV7_PORTR|nr:hypothetical protein [Portunus trituberculatus]
MLEVRDYLKKKKPDVMCIVETKLREEIHIDFKEVGYNSWRRDRKDKGRGGVLIMVILFANYYMGTIEEIFTQHPELKLSVYTRYIDNIFISTNSVGQILHLIDEFK